LLSFYKQFFQIYIFEFTCKLFYRCKLLIKSSGRNAVVEYLLLHHKVKGSSPAAVTVNSSDINKNIIIFFIKSFCFSFFNLGSFDRWPVYAQVPLVIFKLLSIKNSLLGHHVTFLFLIINFYPKFSPS
jgi:hypothetical protein